MQLSNQDQAVLDFIIKYREENGHNPTHVAVAENMPGVYKENLDRKSATASIKRLKDAGYLIPTGRFGDYHVAVDN